MQTIFILKPRLACRAMAPPARQTKSPGWAVTTSPVFFPPVCSGMENSLQKNVMPGLVPGIHAFITRQDSKTWMAGTSATTGPAFGRTRLPGHDEESHAGPHRAPRRHWRLSPYSAAQARRHHVVLAQARLRRGQTDVQGVPADGARAR